MLKKNSSKQHFFPIPNTKFVLAKTLVWRSRKTEENPVPSQPLTKHSHLPLVHKRSAREAVVASFLKKTFFSQFPNWRAPRRGGGEIRDQA